MAHLKVPKDFYKLNKFVTLVADVMFVNGLAFFTTRSRDIRMLTAEHVPHRTAAELGKSLKKVIQIYANGGYVVRTSLMDGEFEKIKDKITGVTINTSAPGEHVGEIERAHRDIKNRCRAVLSLLPYEYTEMSKRVDTDTRFSEYGNLSVNELRKRLADEELDIDGSKEMLVSRLTESAKKRQRTE